MKGLEGSNPSLIFGELPKYRKKTREKGRREELVVVCVYASTLEEHHYITSLDYQIPPKVCDSSPCN